MQVLKDINPNLLLKFPIAHYAAKRGTLKLFKVKKKLATIFLVERDLGYN